MNENMYLHPYYQARLEESVADSFIVLGSIIAIVVIIGIASLF